MANSDWISPNYSLTPPDQDKDGEGGGEGGGSGEDNVVVTSEAANCTLPFLLSRDYNVVTGKMSESRNLVQSI